MFVALLAVVMAACGGGTASTTTEGSSGATTTAAGVTTTAAAGGLYGSHDEIVAAAASEPALSVNTTHRSEVNEGLQAGFLAAYPDLEATVVEQESDEDQKALLELESGQHPYDVLIVGAASYLDFVPWCENLDLQAMANAGTLDIPEGMINPDQPNTIVTGSEMVGNAYNPELVDAADVPQTYDDFLDPKWRGQVLVNPEAEHVAIMMAEDSWGPERTLEWAEQLLANEPVWVDGSSSGLTLMASGEQPLFLMPNYHTSRNIQDEQPGKVEITLIEPIGVLLQSFHCVRLGSEAPASSLLFLEWFAGPEGQAVLDEFGPFKASVYSEGSEIANAIEGREHVIYGWDGVETNALNEWTQAILEVWGFPTAG